ncbi:LysE family translocator [Limibaculum sp. M0105]|uniref:LysE family translocator n=1 Tax=Thermohalobaculum xanthum TaxID=2753746 RepID=A0A8J7M9N3_9RHOB|nr:LysE family translocator [Thermohalobaculum xanthum]MBK0400911.1 LysE family translocator [Thermohalobaculum xanthum]
MSFEVWSVYVATVLLLMSTPGPSHLLMISTAMANGFRRSTATAAGDLSANILQMLAAGLGLAAVLAASEQGFAAVKWAGVAYLAWLGLRQIRRSFRGVAAGRERPAGLRQLWWRGFVTSAANPKAVVFFAALFPQFIAPGDGFWLQMLVLGGTYVAIDASFLAAYGLGAGWLSARLGGPMRAWLDRAAGACLIGAAVLLGLKTAGRN